MVVWTALLALVLVLASGLILLKCFMTWRFGYWKRLGVPFDPPKSMFLGNLDFIMKISVYDFYRNLRIKHNAKYVGVFFTWKPAIIVQSAEIAKRIMVRDYDHFQDRYSFSDPNDRLGSLNLFTVKNPIWSDMRKHVTPVFTSSRLKAITELMNINAQHLVQKIQRDHIDTKKPVVMKDLYTMYTSDTVAFTVFGIRTSALSGEESPLWDNISNYMLNWTYWRGLEWMFVWFMPHLAWLWRTKFFSKEATDHVTKMFFDVVKAREREGRTKTNDKDLVSLLLSLRDNAKLPAGADAKFADDLMLAQVAIFILGAVETSSTTLSFTSHELAHHPDIQEELYDELRQAYEDNGNQVLQYDQLMNCKFLSACINETLRKYSPVPHCDRICISKYKLDDNVTIEPGTPVFFSLPALHLNEEFYENPTEWNPYRPLPTSDNDNMNYNFLPFGEGPRFCIGKRYGLMQVRAAIAQVILNYKMVPGTDPYDVKHDPNSLVLYPLGGGSVNYIPRNKL